MQQPYYLETLNNLQRTLTSMTSKDLKSENLKKNTDSVFPNGAKYKVKMVSKGPDGSTTTLNTNLSRISLGK